MCKSVARRADARFCQKIKYIDDEAPSYSSYDEDEITEETVSRILFYQNSPNDKFFIIWAVL